MILSSLALVALQFPGTQPPQAQPNIPQPNIPQSGGYDVGLYPLGGIQAPDQPNTRSSSSVTRTQRRAPVPTPAGSSSVRVRVGDLATIRGQEHNVVHGIGLVTGLNGSGDSGDAAKQALLNLLTTQNIVLDLGAINSNNVAVVLVQATLPPNIKPGRRLDVRISSIYDAQDLSGGTLVSTELTDSSGQVVYATATGPVSTGGFTASGDGASATRNHPTVATVPLGGTVQREVPTDLVSDHGFVYLDAHALKGSFGNAVRIADTINEIYEGAAVPLDAMTVRVQIPNGLPETALVAFVDSILRRELEPEAFARVVINERTGVIVLGEGVRITRGAVAKGNLTVTIAESAETSQPGGLSGGETQNNARTELVVEEEDSALSVVNGAASVQEVVEVLNVLGVTPRDMIQILQSMAQSGILHAEIVVL